MRKRWPASCRAGWHDQDPLRDAAGPEGLSRLLRRGRPRARSPRRGRGLGARLLRKALARCRRRGIEKIELQVYASNRPARELYRKFGFRQEGRRVRARKLDGKYDDVILMGKLL